MMIDYGVIYEIRIYVPVNGDGKLRLDRVIASQNLNEKYWTKFALSENQRRSFGGVRQDKRGAIAERRVALAKHNRMETMLDDLIYSRGSY